MDKLVYPKAKVEAELAKYASDDKLIEVLEKRAKTLEDLLSNEEIKSRFDKLLGADENYSRRVGTLREYGGKAEKIISVLDKAIAKQEKKGGE